MGGSQSKSMKTSVKTQAEPMSVPPVNQTTESPKISTPQRQAKWDEKAKWDDRSGLRAFCILRHDQYGFLLLQAEKRKKGLHYQLCGGHVDQQEIEALGIEKATQTACARELFEETGIDLRSSSERFHLCEVEPGEASLKGRVFYWVDITDADTVVQGKRPIKALTGQNFKIAISKEHTGFIFEPSVKKAADMLIAHSGGKCTYALLQITERREMGKSD